MERHPAPSAFNFHRNKEKHLLALHGILAGVIADTRLNDAELLFLDTWLKSDHEFKQDGDFLDIQDVISDVLTDGVITQDEMDDINTLLSDVLEFGGHTLPVNDDALINRLLGFLQGIAADGVLNDREVQALNQFLRDNQSLLTSWPGNLLTQRLDDILADGVVTEDERADLSELVSQISGQRFIDSGIAGGLATEFCTDKELDGELHGLVVCFTGKFMSGSRSRQTDLALAAGMTVVKGVPLNLNLLVIGTIVSRDWKFSSHGRKIQAAIEARNKGQAIKIINEETWRLAVSRQA